MKEVKKYTSFEDLKSVEKKSIDNKMILKKHNEFKKIMMHIYAVKTGKTSV
jgi:hypothetical protein